MLDVLINNRYTITAAILFVIGFSNLLLQQNLIKKVIAFNVMDGSTFIFLASRGFVSGRTAASSASPVEFFEPWWPAIRSSTSGRSI